MTDRPRPIEHRYDDPLDLIWMATARGIGWRVVRTDEVYASSDGAGTLFIGASSTLDPDDSLAQMIFHEICHAAVEGALSSPDWGLANRDEVDPSREHACLRTQALLAEAHRLRRFFAPTTDFRAYWDQLPADPLEGTDETTRRDIGEALRRLAQPPFAPHVDAALVATRNIVEIARRFTSRADRPTSLYLDEGSA